MVHCLWWWQLLPRLTPPEVQFSYCGFSVSFLYCFCLCSLCIVYHISIHTISDCLFFSSSSAFPSLSLSQFVCLFSNWKSFSLFNDVTAAYRLQWTLHCWLQTLSVGPVPSPSKHKVSSAETEMFKNETHQSWAPCFCAWFSCSLAVLSIQATSGQTFPTIWWLVHPILSHLNPISNLSWRHGPKSVD